RSRPAYAGTLRRCRGVGVGRARADRGPRHMAWRRASGPRGGVAAALARRVRICVGVLHVMPGPPPTVAPRAAHHAGGSGPGRIPPNQRRRRRPTGLLVLARALPLRRGDGGGRGGTPDELCRGEEREVL